MRKAALEFMTTLSESKPAMLKGVEGWVNIVVRGCLEGMGEIPEDDTETLLEADVRSFPLLFSSEGANIVAAGQRPDGQRVPAHI